MPSVRCFVAVLLCEELRRNIAAVQDGFKRVAPDLKWVAIENLHVTLKFLGNVEETQVETVYAAVRRAARGSAPFEITVARGGAFPDPRRPRIVWVGMDAGAAQLVRLAGHTESELAAAGFPIEDREFKPHVTIGRARNSGRGPNLSRVVEETGEGPIGSQVVSSVAVMRSDLRPSGPTYTPLLEVELGEGAGEES